jgi:hypothetical protein
MHSRIRSFRTTEKAKGCTFSFFPVGHKDDELYVGVLNKQATEFLHTVLDDG